MDREGDVRWRKQRPGPRRNPRPRVRLELEHRRTGPTAACTPSRSRTYHLYLERGAADGADFDDWVTAEKELKVAHN